MKELGVAFLVFVSLFSILSSVVYFGYIDPNYRNVQISGSVYSSSNEKPISNAIVLVKCWIYSSEIWESYSVEKATNTDKDGLFNVRFEKGEALQLEITAEGFCDKTKPMTLRRSKVYVDLYLEAE